MSEYIRLYLSNVKRNKWYNVTDKPYKLQNKLIEELDNVPLKAIPDVESYIKQCYHINSHDELICSLWGPARTYVEEFKEILKIIKEAKNKK